MALPPEQINIKRRREEEPVETLCKEFSPFSLTPRSTLQTLWFFLPWANLIYNTIE